MSEEGFEAHGRRKEGKGGPGFMHKYFHKGAFYSNMDILKDDGRDFTAPTVEDKGIDKSALPAPMQVRGADFGKRGQTKWTHLAAEDTSAKRGDDSLWQQARRRPHPRRGGEPEQSRKRRRER
jgi:microfibrillar-associated protein 1